MKKIALFLYLSTVWHLQAVVPQSDELVTLHPVTTIEMNAITSPMQGSLVFNTDNNEVYERNDTDWHRITSTGSETKILSGQCMDVTGLGTSTSPYIVTRSTPGKNQATAGLVCKQLYDTGCAMSSGMYWINPDGGSTANAFEVYCDMTSKAGGWTRVEYAADLPHINRWTSGDANRWLPSNFTFNLTDTQINAIRAVSTEGRQTYIGSCQGVIHYLYQNRNFDSAFGFRFHNSDETAFNKQHYKDTNITVTDDGCVENDGTLRSTTFEIEDIRVPIINIKSRDNGNNSEKFGSLLTNNPVWFR